jgi:adenylyl-sulfate kinase
MTLPEEPRSDNVVWDHDAVARHERWAAAGQRGATVWFTGLPASGKSTLAKALEHSLLRTGRLAYRLDGDNLRHGLCGDLSFSAADREENVRRTAQVARLMADAGVVAIVALVSPYREGRDAARMLHQADDLPFIEVFVDTPLEICEQRDPKGLYARARAGELSGMTGVDGAYEPATESELHLRPPWTIDDVVEQIRDAISASATRGAV